MYENGKPFFKEWNVVILFECIVCNFHTSVRVVMEFVKGSFENSERKTYANSVLYKIWSRRLVYNSRVCNIKANKVCGFVNKKL